MALVANILNAIGGKPVLDSPDFIAQYPTYLPHSDKSFTVPLSKLTPDALEAFLNIERPGEGDSKPEDENYSSIGQFYEAIEIGIQTLADELGEENLFVGDPAYQLSPESTYYGGSGTMIGVTDLESAMAAMNEIVEQGEGLDHQSIWDHDVNMFHPERGEVGHYFRFQEIKFGQRYQTGDTAKSGPTGEKFTVEWDEVHNMKPNPVTEDYAIGSEIRTKMDAFNKIYSEMLRMLEKCFNGEPALLRNSVGTMYEIKAIAIELMQMPTGDGDTTAGPSFDYVAKTASVDAGLPKIKIRKDGPYIVSGDVGLVHKTKISSNKDEALAWQRGEGIDTDSSYALCRCGASSSKPFCDGTHARIDFDGTETADANLIIDRQEVLNGDGITVNSDHSLCMHATFCNNNITSMRRLMPTSENIQVKTQLVSMVEHCPSGALTYSIDGFDQNIEPKMPAEIAITSENDTIGGPLWVTGGVEIERADGEFIETRNRVTLCRCGASKNKPFCDGSHHKINWVP